MGMAAAVPGIVEADKLYRLNTLKEISGLGTWGIRQLRKSGLRVLYVGGKAFVRGSDFIEHIDAVAQPRHFNGK